MKRFILSGFILLTTFTVASAQSLLVEFHNEGRYKTPGFQTERFSSAKPITHRITEWLIPTDTLERTRSGFSVSVKGKNFEAPLVFDFPYSRHGDKLYVSNPTARAVLNYTLTGTDTCRIEALVDSMSRVAIRHEECTTDIALTGGQNCACYALACLLRANGIDPEPLFAWNTMIPEGSMMPLADLLLVKQRELKVGKNFGKWTKSIEFAPDAFYLCYDAEGKNIHAFFHGNGRFWSKNGMLFTYISYASAAHVLQHYDKTVRLDEYILKPEYKN